MSETEKISPLQIFSWLILVVTLVAILAVINHLTRDRIAENRHLATRKILQQIIPREHNNDVFADTLIRNEPNYLGSDHPVTVIRSRKDSLPLGVVIYPVIAEGYKGPIELAIGINLQGQLSGVRVLQENETEGLGAQIHQNKSDWILSFTGLSFKTVPPEQWDVLSENGYFDQISGATITSRSVINAVKNTLNYHELTGETLYK